MIDFMTESMLDQIRILDAECFNKIQNPRDIENIRALFGITPKGCYVITIEKKLVGYIFTRVHGNFGYIGPLGVKPEFRGKHLGKKMVLKGIEYLKKSGCTSIGLETLPELGNNVGLYLKTMFIPTFPTIMYKKKKPCQWQEDDSIISGNDIDYKKIEDFNSELGKENGGYSLYEDIKYALLKSDEDVYFYVNEDRVIGFLGYTPYLYPYVWGAFLHDGCQRDTFNKLFSRLERRNEGKELKMRVNSCYQKTLEMLDDTFEVERCLLRMVLKGYEGKFLSLDNKSFIARAWIA